MPHDTLEPVEPLDTLDLLGGGVILNAEDGLGDTIKPRLEAAGADLTKVRAIRPMKSDKDIVSIPRDIPTIIEGEIRKAKAKLLIIDPLSAFMHGDPNKDSDVRKALTPLAEMAQRTGVAVVVVRHFNKNLDAKALYRGGGSIGMLKRAKAKLPVRSEKVGPNGQRRWHLVQGGQECQEAQEDQDGQDDHVRTKSDCECGRCIDCLKQELPFEAG